MEPSADTTETQVLGKLTESEDGTEVGKKRKLEGNGEGEINQDGDSEDKVEKMKVDEEEGGGGREGERIDEEEVVVIQQQTFIIVENDEASKLRRLLNLMTKPDLQGMLRSKGLSPTGRKDELIERILQGVPSFQPPTTGISYGLDSSTAQHDIYFISPASNSRNTCIRCQYMIKQGEYDI